MMCVNSKLLQLSYDVVNSFYSKSMRVYLFEHPKEFSIGQLASLATQHMDLEKIPQLLKSLSEVSVIPEEKAYLKSAAEEWADECYGIYSLEDKSPGLVYPWQIYDYLPVLLPNVEVVSEHALPEKKKEHLNGFVRDMALLDLLTNQDWWNLYEEYEKMGINRFRLRNWLKKGRMIK